MPIGVSELGFPNDLANCNACHVNETWGDALLPAVVELRNCTEPLDDDDDFCDDPFYALIDTVLVPPVTSACTGCHDQTSTFAHAEVMTTSLGVESCIACHGSGNAFDVTTAHGL